jgi:hypothetical protein
MFLEDVELSIILVPAVMLASLAFPITRLRGDPRAAEAGKEVARLQQVTVVMLAIVVLLVFLLPRTSSLSTLGLPKTPDDIGSPERLLAYLQTYNKALTRTVDVVFWFLSFFMFWFLPAFYFALKAVAALKRDQSQRREKAFPTDAADLR